MLPIDDLVREVRALRAELNCPWTQAVREVMESHNIRDLDVRLAVAAQAPDGSGDTEEVSVPATSSRDPNEFVWTPTRPRRAKKKRSKAKKGAKEVREEADARHVHALRYMGE